MSVALFAPRSIMFNVETVSSGDVGVNPKCRKMPHHSTNSSTQPHYWLKVERSMLASSCAVWHRAIVMKSFKATRNPYRILPTTSKLLMSPKFVMNQCQHKLTSILCVLAMIGQNVCNCMTLPVPAHLESMFSKGLLARPHPNLYVLGTVHIGSKSAQEAQLLIETVKPSNVVVEIPPSRLKRIQQKAAQIRMEAEREEASNDRNSGIRNDNAMGSERTKDKSLNGTGLWSAVRTFPAFASAGYAKGGLSGLLFSTVIVWSSLLKRSTTADEEVESLPRRNEFEAAVAVCEDVGANVIPADLEFEDLIQTVAKSMTPLKWMSLGIAVLSESIGLRESDPIRRGKHESIVAWENRRRDVKTARASRAHGEYATPELSNVLVQYRDAEFARICLEMLEKNMDRGETTVCIVGLVHLDGIVDICCRETETETGKVN